MCPFQAQSQALPICKNTVSFSKVQLEKEFLFFKGAGGTELNSNPCSIRHIEMNGRRMRAQCVFVQLPFISKALHRREKTTKGELGRERRLLKDTRTFECPVYGYPYIQWITYRPILKTSHWNFIGHLNRALNGSPAWSSISTETPEVGWEIRS